MAAMRKMTGSDAAMSQEEQSAAVSQDLIGALKATAIYLPAEFT